LPPQFAMLTLVVKAELIFYNFMHSEYCHHPETTIQTAFVGSGEK